MPDDPLLPSPWEAWPADHAEGGPSESPDEEADADRPHGPRRAEPGPEALAALLGRIARRGETARGSHRGGFLPGLAPGRSLRSGSRAAAGLDQLRRRNQAMSPRAPETPHGGDPEGEGRDPQDLLVATRAHRNLHRALAALEPLPRQMVALAFFRGFTHEEIASHTALPLGTVKSHTRLPHRLPEVSVIM